MTSDPRPFLRSPDGRFAARPKSEPWSLEYTPPDPDRREVFEFKSPGSLDGRVTLARGERFSMVSMMHKDACAFAGYLR